MRSTPCCRVTARRGGREQYRRGLFRSGDIKDLKPGEIVLVCGGDGAGGTDCVRSTTLDRMIAAYMSD